MFQRALVLVICSAGLAGCANEPNTQWQGYQGLGLVPSSFAMDLVPADPDIERARMARKSYASRVLAAIALERVTGRKPDPARLIATD